MVPHFAPSHPHTPTFCSFTPSHTHILLLHTLTQALKNRTKKIFVGGVPTSMPEETIRDYFVQFGEVSGEGGRGGRRGEGGGKGEGWREK